MNVGAQGRSLMLVEVSEHNRAREREQEKGVVYPLGDIVMIIAARTVFPSFSDKYSLRNVASCCVQSGAQ